MVKKAQEMYRELSPESGEFFDFMVEHQLFDLETKKEKRVGGYCTSLPLYHAPFIFSNFNGTQADVNVLTHEAGHAFAGFIRQINSRRPRSSATVPARSMRSTPWAWSFGPIRGWRASLETRRSSTGRSI